MKKPNNIEIKSISGNTSSLRESVSHSTVRLNNSVSMPTYSMDSVSVSTCNMNIKPNNSPNTVNSTQNVNINSNNIANSNKK